MSSPKSDVDLLVVGAGPTGLAAACEAVRCGLTVRIIDKAARRGVHSKALVMHARTLESLPSSLAARLVESGTEFTAMNIFNKTQNVAVDGSLKRPATRVVFSSLDWGDTVSNPEPCAPCTLHPYPTQTVLCPTLVPLSLGSHTCSSGFPAAPACVLRTIRTSLSPPPRVP